jgi:two-component system NtrC family sensor kinase
MSNNNERILIVESDPEISDLISRQALQPFGYQVKVVSDASQAIQQVAKFTPDLIITNINLPGLSGKDLMVALNSQGTQIPLIVIAEKGQENNVIQAFRLGASDYLLWPAREAEVVSAVERSLKQVREKHSHLLLGQKLKGANLELEARVRELTTIFAVGKAVISIRDQAALLEKLVEGTVYMSSADFGWVMLLNERTKGFELAAHRNLPEVWANKLGKTLDDGISSLVALSGETLAINGVPLKRFKVANLGQSAAAVPIKIDHKVVGIFLIVREKNLPIEKGTLALLEAVADYASISLVNAHLFRALQETADAARAGEKRNLELLANMRAEIQRQLQPVTYPLELLLSGRMGGLSNDQQKALSNVREAIQSILKLTEIGQSKSTTNKEL